MPGPGALTPSDAELLARAAEGDRSAFEVLVDRHAAALLRYLRGLTDDEARAEDALQDTFLAAWTSAGSFRGDGSARSWLLTIARNRAHRQRRRRAGEPEEHLPLQALAKEAGWGGEDARIAERLAARELVELGFRGLEPDDREILLLRDGQGLTGPEAAEVLGIGLAAQKSRLHRARLRFMKQLRETDHGP